MHRAAHVPVTLTADITDRAGIVTRRELLASGLSRGAVAGVIRRSTTLLPGVYLAGATTPSHTARAWAGVLYAGDEAHVTGRSALHLAGVLDAPPTVVEIAVPHARTVMPQKGFRFVRHRTGVHAPPQPRSLPVARTEDALLDVAGELPMSDALALVAAACQRGTTRADRVRTRLDARHRHPHRRLLEQVLDDISAGATTHLELGHLNLVERRHHLPQSTRQFVVPETGHRADAAYEELKMLMEADGDTYHRGEARAADLKLDAEHLAAGYATIRMSTAMVFATPCRTAARIDEIRVARGGAPAFRPCPDCSR